MRTRSACKRTRSGRLRADPPLTIVRRREQFVTLLQATIRARCYAVACDDRNVVPRRLAAKVVKLLVDVNAKELHVSYADADSTLVDMIMWSLVGRWGNYAFRPAVPTTLRSAVKQLLSAVEHADSDDMGLV